MFLKKGKDTSVVYIPYLIDTTSPLPSLVLVAKDLKSTGKGKLIYFFFGRGIGMRYSTSMNNKR